MLTPARIEDWEAHYRRRINMLRDALRACLQSEDEDNLREIVIAALRADDIAREGGPRP